MKVLAIAALLAATGCEASLAGDGTNNSTDANGSGSGSDIDAAVQIDAAPACANNRRIYLNFGGVTLDADATASDALTNKARWLTNTSAMVPAWRAGSGTRATEIQEVVNGVEQRLAATPIEVVTERPVAGPYVMVVLGGANTNNGGTVGTIYSYATSYHDCGDVTKSDVGWVSNMPGESTSYVADLVIGAVGWGLGLDGTTDPDGCMCGWASNCTSAVGACTLSASIASEISSGSIETACVSGNQNEVAAFTTGFCQ